MTIRAALYVRQSEDLTEGMERQLERTHALAVARGWEVAATFEDNDISASKPRGVATAWGQMLARVGKDFEVVIAVDLDRLLRSTRDLNTLIDLGAKVVTVDGEIDLSTADGEFRATMLAGIARFETRRKSERQVRGYEHRAKKGEMIGGWGAFGFDGSEHVPAEAFAIREGYTAFLSGVPLAGIARDWNALGLTTTHGSQWNRTSVRKVLLNARNAGLVTYRGEVERDAVAAWAPIVEEETFLAVQDALRNPQRRSAVTGGRRLLSGLAICGVCGATLHAGGGNKAGRGTYRCSGSLGHVARLAEPVENYVSAVVVARLAREDARDLLAASNRPAVDDLRTEALGIRERLAALAVDYADGLIGRDERNVASERMRSRLAAVEALLVDSGRVDVLGPLVTANDVRAVWDDLGLDRQRVVIDTLMHISVLPPGRGARTFQPESVSIAWRS